MKKLLIAVVAASITSFRGTITMEIFKNVKLVLGLLLLTTLLSGCSSTDVVIFDSTSRQPTAESEVEVLLETPDRPHQVIARIQFGPDAFVSDYHGQTKAIIKRAAVKYRTLTQRKIYNLQLGD